MPDGMFAVVTPDKGGKYTVKRFDDKTGKLIDSNTGDGESLFRQSIAHLTGPEGVVKYAMAERTARATEARDDKKSAAAQTLQAQRDAAAEARLLATLGNRAEVAGLRTDTSLDVAKINAAARLGAANVRAAGSEGKETQTDRDRAKSASRIGQFLKRYRTMENGKPRPGTATDLTNLVGQLRDLSALRKANRMTATDKAKEAGLTKHLAAYGYTADDLINDYNQARQAR
jgi:hypothetical protein